MYWEGIGNHVWRMQQAHVRRPRTSLSRDNDVINRKWYFYSKTKLDRGQKCIGRVQEIMHGECNKLMFVGLRRPYHVIMTSLTGNGNFTAKLSQIEVQNVLRGYMKSCMGNATSSFSQAYDVSVTKPNGRLRFAVRSESVTFQLFLLFFFFSAQIFRTHLLRTHQTDLDKILQSPSCHGPIWPPGISY